jgi:hypothetical protein
VSDARPLPPPAEVTLLGKTYSLSPLPEKDVRHMCELMLKLTKLELEELDLTVRINPILRKAGEEYLLACLLPLNQNFDPSILRAVPMEEMTRAVNAAVALSTRMLNAPEE